MHESDLHEPPKPDLKLEFAGDGPGQKSITAIGTAGDGPELDRSTLPDPPWWFVFVKGIFKRSFQKSFQKRSLEDAMSTLKILQVPPLYRLGLGLRWGFIIPDRDDFTVEDFATVLQSSAQTSRELDLIEYRSTYRIWKTLNGRPLSELEQFIEVMTD